MIRTRGLLASCSTSAAVTLTAKPGVKSKRRIPRSKPGPPRGPAALPKCAEMIASWVAATFALTVALLEASGLISLACMGESNCTMTRTLPSRCAIERISSTSGAFCDSADETCADAADAKARSQAAAMAPRAATVRYEAYANRGTMVPLLISAFPILLACLVAAAIGGGRTQCRRRGSGRHWRERHCRERLRWQEQRRGFAPSLQDRQGRGGILGRGRQQTGDVIASPRVR